MRFDGIRKLELAMKSNVKARTDNLQIGIQIRDLRKARGITLQQMAAHIGRSVGYTSQVERGQSNLPIPVLQAISERLDVPMSWFFQGERPVPSNERDCIVRQQNRKCLNFAGTGIREELLSPRVSDELKMVVTTFEPGAGSKEPRARKGPEAGVVQTGTLLLGFGDEVHTLHAGDSFSLTGESPHWVMNGSQTEPCVVIWSLVGQVY